MSKTVCFTGHRPNKLPGQYDWYDKRNIEMLKELRTIIDFLIKEDGVDTFITGGALGIDQMAFKVVQKLKMTKYPHIKQILAMPFANQDKNWIPESKKTLEEIKSEANEIICVDEVKSYMVNLKNVYIGDYHPVKMFKRNEYMVDNSDIVIAVYNGDQSGGTYNCINYAKTKNKEIIVLDPKKFV